MVATQNQHKHPYMQSFSAAATVAPIVLYSGHSQGNLYVASKNSFLEFYTEERKAVRRNAAGRSASCDSCFKEVERSTIAPSSPSLSPRSLRSSDGNPSFNVPTKAALPSPDVSPRNNNYNNNQNAVVTSTNGDMNFYDTSNKTSNYPYHFHDGNCYPEVCYDDQYYVDASYECYDYMCSGAEAGYPMNQVMMMAPNTMPMPCVQEQQEMSPTVMRPHLPSKKLDLREANLEPVTEITTLMIRGIPCSFSQDTLMKLIDNAGLKGKYDFFYLPRAGNHGSNLGYAFVNFTEAECAEHFVMTFNGVPLDPSRSMKVCTISPGDIQGLGNLRKHFRRTAVSRGSRGPVFLKVFDDEDEL